MRASARWLLGIVVVGAALAGPTFGVDQAAPAPTAAPAPAAPAAPPPAAAPASVVAGDWEGVLDTGAVKLRTVLHVTVNADGSLTATMDSPDQGAAGLPVATTTFKDGVLVLDLPNLAAHYEGKLNAAGTEIEGQWAQRGAVLKLTFARPAPKPAAAPAVAPAPSPPIRDTWLGTLEIGPSKLRLVLHIVRSSEGVLTATVDSLDQGAMALPVDSITFKDGVLRFEMKRLMASYEGKMNAASDELTGVFTQAGQTLPLVFRAVEQAPVVKRPQEPQKPYPYREEEVTYENQAAGVKFAATLTLPQGAGPFPAVVLLTGSGPQDRNETVFGHRPFLVLADHLTRQGVAVLRADDRGVGGTTAGTPGVTTEDLAGDALAGVAYLKTRKEIDPRRIGLLGHSEGGMEAPMAAVRSRDVAFIVLMAGTGVPGEQVLLRQSELIARAMGAPEEQIQNARKINEQVYEAVRNEKDPAAAERRVRALLSAQPELKGAALDVQVQAVMSPWFRFFLTYDPRPTLAKVKVPVLAIGGERDLQVPAKENLDAIRAALDAGGNKDHTVQVLPGLNHLFQECQTGSVTEYSQIEQTMSPVALKTVSDWILAHTAGKKTHG